VSVYVIHWNYICILNVLHQIKGEGRMLMTAGDSPVPATNYETAIALRGMALLQPYLPKYLLAPEVAVLLHYLPDERQRMLFATLWNTGARITEALTITPEDLQLDGPRPCIRLRTLKQRQRGRGRPSADEKIARIVPLLDAAYVDQLRRYLATFRTGRRRPLFAVSRKTAWLWMQQAIDRAREEGIEFALPAINPKRCGTVLPCICFSTTCRRKSSRPIWGMNVMKARRCI
jgi:integrase